MLFAALLLLQAAACPAVDRDLPAPLAGWTVPAESFEPGKAVILEASATPPAGMPAAQKPGGAAMVGFRIATAGSYGVALDQPGWIDVLPGASGGEPVKSVSHGHGPECSTIRKIVRFELQPGAYRLYVNALAKPQARVMLVAPE